MWGWGPPLPPPPVPPGGAGGGLWGGGGGGGGGRVRGGRGLLCLVCVFECGTGLCVRGCERRGCYFEVVGMRRVVLCGRNGVCVRVGV